MTETERATTSTPAAQEDPRAFLDTPFGENAFFKAVARARPVGVHKYFHMINIRSRIQRDTGILVPFADLWDKLSTLYDLAALEQFEGISWPKDDGPPSPAPTPISYPSETDNLRTHGFFQHEFSLTEFDDIYPHYVARAAANTPSPSTGSPSPPSPAETATSTRGKGTRGRGRGGRPSGRGRGRGRGRATTSSVQGGPAGDSSSELSSDDNDKADADDPADSRAGSTVQSGTPMDEDGESEQSESQDEDARRTKGKKRAAKGKPPVPPKKRRKSGPK